MFYSICFRFQMYLIELPPESKDVLNYSSTKVMNSNINWTEWSTIQGVIARVISNRPSSQRVIARQLCDKKASAEPIKIENSVIETINSVITVCYSHSSIPLHFKVKKTQRTQSP